MNRQGDIAILEIIEKRIVANGKHKLVRGTGNEGAYAGMGISEKSALSYKRYRVRCSKYFVLRGFFDIVLRFDYRTQIGRLSIKNRDLAGLFQVSRDMENLVYSIPRKEICIKRR